MVGALGFEPRLAGVFRLVYAIFITWAFGARGTTRLYYTPIGEPHEEQAVFDFSGY